MPKLEKETYQPFVILHSYLRFRKVFGENSVAIILAVETIKDNYSFANSNELMVIKELMSV